MYDYMILIQLHNLLNITSNLVGFIKDCDDLLKHFLLIYGNNIELKHLFFLFAGINIIPDPRLFSSVVMGKITRLGLIKTGKTATALPGYIGLKIEPNLLKEINKRCRKKIIITGTNGKTTTNNLINHIVQNGNNNILSNLRGANMPQGIASSFIEDTRDNYDWGIFEVDEGSFIEITRDIKPDYILITNFFRDQLDRYGEIESTVSMVYEATKNLDTTLILNSDDPLVAQFKELGKNNIFYGLKENKFSDKEQKIVETRQCPICNNYLDYDYFNYGQLGGYHCNECGFENPPYNFFIENIEYKNNNYCFDIKNESGNQYKGFCFDYEGIYNIYNCCAAFTFCSKIGIPPGDIIERMENFDYHLGRMEEIPYEDKIIKINLAKNPIGLTELIKNISIDKREKSILFILNDNPADGRDISWIWDADIESFKNIENLKTVYFSGRRAEDIALRLKYEDIHIKSIEIDDNIRSAIDKIIHEDKVDIVYLVPTYTAVFQTRDIALDLVSNGG